MTTLRPETAQAADAPEVWVDKKRRLWLMGLIAPTALFVMLPIVWALNRRFGGAEGIRTPDLLIAKAPDRRSMCCRA